MTEMIYGSMSVPVVRESNSNWWHTVDRMVLSAVFLLFGIGLLLSMASSPALAEKNNLAEFYYTQRQFIFGSLALITMLILSRFSPTMVRRLGVLGFFCALIALLALPIIGTNFGKGATRWISLGFASVQPSEFLKPGFVIMIAWLVASGKVKNGPPGRLMATLLTGFLVTVLALQPDFGQATLLLAAFFAIMFVAGFRTIWMICLAFIAMLGAQFAYNNSEHVAGRIDSFLAQDLDPHTQIGYAANAISNGGFWGAGVGEGTVKYSLPDAHTDFIMAVAAEEYGVLLCWIVTGIFGFIVFRSFMKLMRSGDHFTRLAGVGLTTLIGAQSMINLGVAARLFPTKGMTLPFISYGGSSLVAIGITFGFLLALTRERSTPTPIVQGMNR